MILDHCIHDIYMLCLKHVIRKIIKHNQHQATSVLISPCLLNEGIVEVKQIAWSNHDYDVFMISN